MIGSSIVSLLSGVTAKVYPLVAPQGTAYPYVVYQIISDVPTNDKDGRSRLDTYRLQLTAWGAGADVETLAASIRSTLDRYRGTNNSNVIDKIIFDGINDLYDEDSEFIGKAIDFLIRIKL